MSSFACAFFDAGPSPCASRRVASSTAIAMSGAKLSSSSSSSAAPPAAPLPAPAPPPSPPAPPAVPPSAASVPPSKRARLAGAAPAAAAASASRLAFLAPMSFSAPRNVPSRSMGAVFSSTHTKKPPVFCAEGTIRHALDSCARIASSLGGNMDRFIAFGSSSAARISSSSSQLPLVSMTDHVVRPGERLRPGSSAEQSTTRMLPPQRSNSCATTASFSIGFNEHVEYTMRPPILSCVAPRSAMLTCSGCRKMPWPGRQSVHIFGVLRIVPSPLQGTSASTRSNQPTPGVCSPSSLRVNDGKRCASCVVASRHGVPMRFIMCTSM
mmetsp:Transcript_5588/g.19968  ORF Transcript_5588/g.19968 Transcript_5588/m.19968 type:complete len:325 (+) Transcript_5588:856-1830(+)